MTQSFKKNPVLAESYDTIVIGSGIGSMTAAALLSKEGQKVLVLERHYTVGGFTHVFKRKGYEWDVGIHYIGEVGRPQSILKKLFDYVTDSKLEWADMGEVYDRIYIGEQSFDFVKGVQNWKDKMKSYFPGEEEAIDRYVDLIFEANKSSKNFFMSKSLPTVAASLVGGLMNRKFYSFADQKTYDVLKTLTDNELLIKVLCGQYGDFGLPPKESSFYMHATVVKHYFSGGFFPVGGSSKIAEYIDKVIEKAGGTMLVKAEVKEVLLDKNKAVGIEMSDGTKFYAKNIISGAGIFNSFQKFLPAEVNKRHNLQQSLSKLKPSVAHSCLYVGLNGSPEELGLPKTNFWIYPGDVDHDTCIQRYLEDVNQEFPLVYVSFPSAKDPDWSNRYPGKSTIDIITLLPWEVCAEWDGTPWMKRGEAYNDLKENISQRLLDIIYKHIPAVKGKVDHYELSSPLTTKHFMNYDKGELYGLDHSPSRFRNKALRPKTPVKNYYLTGQDIVTCGVGAAMFAGLLTVSAMGESHILKKVMKSN